jgi:hypothetical protein
MKNNQIDNLFREGLGGIEQTPPPAAWEGIRQEISGTEISFWGKFNGYLAQPLVYNGLIALAAVSVVAYFVTANLSQDPIAKTTPQVNIESESPASIENNIASAEAIESQKPELEPVKETTGIIGGKSTKDKVALNDSVKVILVDSPANGIISYEEKLQSFNYEPNVNFFGVDSFTFVKVNADGTKSPLSTIRLQIDPEITLNPNFEFVEVGDNMVKFENTSLINSTDPRVKSPDVIAWTFGDGTVSPAKSPNHMFASPGEFEVCLAISIDTIQRQICKHVSIAGLTKEEAESKIDAKGKANTPVKININNESTPGKKKVRKFQIPVKANGTSFLPLDFTFRGIAIVTDPMKEDGSLYGKK